MEVRGILRASTMYSPNKKSTPKGQRLSKPKIDLDGVKTLADKITFGGHPAATFLRGSNPNYFDFRKFATVIYKGLFYSINNLKGPTEEFINKKKVKLVEPAGTFDVIQIPKRSS